MTILQIEPIAPVTLPFVFKVALMAGFFGGGALLFMMVAIATEGFFEELARIGAKLCIAGMAACGLFVIIRSVWGLWSL